MAIIHRADITPSKRDLLHAWLGKQSWSGTGETELLGAYRFDDPAGEVGVEAMIVRRGDVVLHVPVTYRAAPLPGAERHLLGTVQHSVLGERWVHDAVADPVALGCFVRALRSEQQQAVMEVFEGDAFVEVREPTTRVRVEAGDAGGDGAVDDVTVIDVDGAQLRIVRVIGSDVAGQHRLVAEWADGQGVVATLAA